MLENAVLTIKTMMHSLEHVLATLKNLLQEPKRAATLVVGISSIRTSQDCYQSQAFQVAWSFVQSNARLTYALQD